MASFPPNSSLNVWRRAQNIRIHKWGGHFRNVRIEEGGPLKSSFSNTFFLPVRMSYFTAASTSWHCALFRCMLMEAYWHLSTNPRDIEVDKSCLGSRAWLLEEEVFLWHSGASARSRGAARARIKVARVWLQEVLLWHSGGVSGSRADTWGAPDPAVGF